jgi:hypothetical protein
MGYRRTEETLTGKANECRRSARGDSVGQLEHGAAVCRAEALAEHQFYGCLTSQPTKTLSKILDTAH